MQSQMTMISILRSLVVCAKRADIIICQPSSALARRSHRADVRSAELHAQNTLGVVDEKRVPRVPVLLYRRTAGAEEARAPAGESGRNTSSRV